MDLVWNSTLAAQIKAASQQALRGQLSDIQETVTNFNLQIRQQ